MRHLLVTGGEASGVIDWGDTCIGDPALDLSWTMLGTTRPFAEALEGAYRPDDTIDKAARLTQLIDKAVGRDRE